MMDDLKALIRKFEVVTGGGILASHVLPGQLTSGGFCTISPRAVAQMTLNPARPIACAWFRGGPHAA